ncbi:magnesium chelatase subunit D [Aurantimonas sp. VKM B-3413]|uniref:magnesium chelatase subunit D n=1 Tax=Aurantimonas sp. VKM B-3413 TaxID=2779401 RepID=UPI001E3788FC|nr:magnesium chelatase subunit D [Aurantimonas sp. VKM B-3413]
MSGNAEPADLFRDALTALALFAVDPRLGLRLSARAGLARDTALARLHVLLPADRPFRRIPAAISETALIGGLDIAASLAARRPIAERGLLAACDGGIVVAAMAERMRPETAALLAHALDTGLIRQEREGLSQEAPARIGVLALDEGMEPDEAPPPALVERLGLWADLDGADPRQVADAGPGAAGVAAARALLSRVTATEDAITLLCQAAIALGIMSLRAPGQALRAARAAAALAGRTSVEEDDLDLAIRHVLVPRATQLPAAPQESEAEAETEAETDAADPPSETPDPPDAENDDEEPEITVGETPGDMTVEAAEAFLPPDLLERLAGLMRPAPMRRGGGRAGTAAKAARRGRTIGVREGDPRRDRLDLVATLRAAAPWQPLRRSERPGAASGRLDIRAADIRVRRIRGKTETATIFAVDASGSAALARLAEAKGAVERILAECYIRRERVALVAFRGTRAEVLLPETRSLTRAKRSLAAFPAGGGTPLASGISAALGLAKASARDGRMPLIALLTDGRANIGRDGAAGRPAAMADAKAAAAAVRSAGVAALVIDLSLRPGPAARDLADAMGASYLALPRADSAALSEAVGAVARPSGRERRPGGGTATG